MSTDPHTEHSTLLLLYFALVDLVATVEPHAREFDDALVYNALNHAQDAIARARSEGKT